MKKKYSLFDTVNTVVMILLCVLCLYPIWYIIIYAFNDGADAMRGGIYFWPRQFTLDNFATVFKHSEILGSYGVTILRTLLGTVATVAFTAVTAYPLSKRNLFGKKIWMGYGLVTMFFSGGLIPTFLLYKGLNLLDSFWVFIVPSLLSFFNVLIFMSFYESIPDSLEESARMDGGNDWIVFLRIIVPLSKPVLATVALFCGVGHWNDYFSGVMYITRNTYLEPIQTYMYRIISQTSATKMAAEAVLSASAQTITSNSVKYATMVATTLPIVCVYPFLQKYFVKGMMIGAVKQ